MTIRTVTPDDAAAVVAVSNPIEPTSFATSASFRALLERRAPPETERLVAELDGRIVAWAPSGRHADGSGWFWIGVEQRARRRGVGSALYERIETRLRARRTTVLRTRINDDDGRRFVERRGFVRTNVLRLQALELAFATCPSRRSKRCRCARSQSTRSARCTARRTRTSRRARRPRFTDDDFCAR